MGGVETDEWYLYPEKPAILIGTQDMLLSRALNRGYAASRFHWPIDFGLLNNDCLWVFDEPQLMASGVSTSAQLAGLRQSLGTFSQCPSVWMSATLEPAWLDTIDFRDKFAGEPLELDENDYDPQRALHKRMTAQKRLAELGVSASKEMKDVAKAVLTNHVPGTQTLVVLNTVERAKVVYAELEKLRKKSPTPKLLLVHSRFRPHERKHLNDQLQEKGESAADRIIIATQVVEAGVDISSRTLITELAPWASIVQRIGRCNRTGDDGPGQVFWIDLGEKLSLPYTTIALDFARRHLKKLEGQSVSPRALDDYKRANEKPDEPFLPFEHKHVLRRRDLLDLFDTSPDLSGNDIDIQRFVRSDDPDTDVQVFWRDTTADDWDVSPQRKEICNVPIGSIKAFLKKEKKEGFVWDHLDDEWRPVRDPERDIRPGQTILLPTTVGGYSELGWDPDSKAAVPPLPPDKQVKPEASGSDPNSTIPVALTIAEHTQHVCEELADLRTSLGEWLEGWPKELADAARWHDAGKALLVAQQAMHNTETPDPSRLLAKSGRTGKLNYGKYGRKHFRHELGSALAVLQQKTDWPFIIAYLIAAHHGRVRLVIRALPGENVPTDPSIRFALGIRDGDALPEVDLGGNVNCPTTALDLSPMQLGGEGSWTARALKLLADLGPFKLAYLEALLRAADVRASQMEAKP
jgi:CRISPR-associated endonuclease/helicase Cas3